MILAVLQARMTSTRLPGKVLMPILGEPMLFRQIERVNRCGAFDALVVATSNEPTDDALAAACKARGIDVARGSRDDVLDRFMTAAAPYKPDTVVRLTGDCPLADPGVIARVIDLFRTSACDYASNVIPPTFPDGLDVEVVRFQALARAHAEAKLPSEREHVMPYIRNHPEIFKIANYAETPDRSNLRWTVDEPADFAFVSRVYGELYPANPAFTTQDILDLIARNPAIGDINASLERNAGFQKSLAADADHGTPR
jgi:spore coat polysaccharide biosynthesis protein SpsF (cytidylyltransferase family)